MRSEDFYRRFQQGQLGDLADFFSGVPFTTCTNLSSSGSKASRENSDTATQRRTSLLPQPHQSAVGDIAHCDNDDLLDVLEQEFLNLQ